MNLLDLGCCRCQMKAEWMLPPWSKEEVRHVTCLSSCRCDKTPYSEAKGWKDSHQLMVFWKPQAEFSPVAGTWGMLQICQWIRKQKAWLEAAPGCSSESPVPSDWLISQGPTVSSTIASPLGTKLGTRPSLWGTYHSQARGSHLSVLDFMLLMKFLKDYDLENS